MTEQAPDLRTCRHNCQRPYGYIRLPSCAVGSMTQRVDTRPKKPCPGSNHAVSPDMAKRDVRQDRPPFNPIFCQSASGPDMASTRRRRLTGIARIWGSWRAPIGRDPRPPALCQFGNVKWTYSPTGWQSKCVGLSVGWVWSYAVSPLIRDRVNPERAQCHPRLAQRHPTMATVRGP